MSGEESARRGRGRLAEKRAAILRAALTTFGRDGYSRASIDVIAKEACVSTRTIYNHFAGKEELFRTVIEESSVRVRDAQLEVLERHAARRDERGLEQELIDLAEAWLEPMRRFPEHYALLRQINAEAGHIPREVLETWQETGPRAAHAALARHMATLGDRLPAAADDPGPAASHLVLLTGAEIANRSLYGALPLADVETADIIRAGVRTFLYGHLPRPGTF